MSPSVVVGAAIVLNVGIMVGGVVWARRQLKLVAAERAAADRGPFTVDALPPPGEAVQILVDDERGTPAEREAMHWPDLGWVDATTRLRIEDEVLGWRRPPVGTRRQLQPARAQDKGAGGA